MAALDFAALSLGEIVTSGKGAKTCPITWAGQPLMTNLAPMPVCFEPSAYGDESATRVNIVFRADDTVAAWLDELDEWVLQQAAKQSVRFFGKAKTVEQLGETYQPIVKRSSKYPAQIKAKMNLAEPGKTKIWSDGIQRDAPDVWVGCLVQPRIKVRGLYFMGAANFGVVLEAMDLQVVDEPCASCPF